MALPPRRTFPGPYAGRAAGSGQRAAAGWRRARVRKLCALKLRRPDGPGLRAVCACAFRWPGAGAGSPGRFNPGARRAWETLPGTGIRVGPFLPSSLHLPSDHDRYVVPVRYSLSAPPCAQVWRYSGPRTTGTPGCPPVPTVSDRAPVSARSSARAVGFPVPAVSSRISVCGVLSPYPAPGVTGVVPGTTLPGSLLCACAPSKVSGRRGPAPEARSRARRVAPPRSPTLGALGCAVQFGTDTLWSVPAVCATPRGNQQSVELMQDDGWARAKSLQKDLNFLFPRIFSFKSLRSEVKEE